MDSDDYSITIGELITRVHNLEKEIDGLYCALGTSVELLDPLTEDFAMWTDAQKLYAKRLRSLVRIRREALEDSVKVSCYTRFTVQLGEEA